MSKQKKQYPLDFKTMCHSAVMPECFYRASRFLLAVALAAALDSR